MRSAQAATISRAAIALAAAASAAYAWWATGTQPFTLAADLAVLAPVLVVLTMALWPGRAQPESPGDGGAPLERTWIWVLLAAAAVGLEATALALGGKSRSVPSLSTVVDQALAWHATRWVLFLAWLAVAALPSVRRIRRRRRPAPEGAAR